MKQKLPRHRPISYSWGCQGQKELHDEPIHQTLVKRNGSLQNKRKDDRPIIYLIPFD
jgi:hypothetical protein